MLIFSNPRCRSALSGADIEVWCVGLGVAGSRINVATSAIPISTETPKNGPRQLISPRSPPSSGPAAMPRPSAASYNTIAPAKPPCAEATMTASEVAMKRALPSPQPARKPMMPPIDWEKPASAENVTMIARPAMSVRLAPSRLETQFVTSIATAVTTR